jgi:hypothetical protein
MKLSRRDFFVDSASLVTGGCLVAAGVNRAAFAAERAQGFVLYVHAGSWDGFAAGLLQPEKEGAFPLGVFERNTRVPAANPFLNEHVRHGAHIFHHYNKVLAGIADNLIHITCQAGSADHNVAGILQRSGAPNAGYPHWVLGAGQMLRPSTSIKPAFVVGRGQAMAAGAAPNVIGVAAGDLSSLQRALAQPASIGANPPSGSHRKLVQAMIESLASQGRASVLQDNIRSTIEATITTSYEGIPEIEPSNPLVMAAISAINEASIRATIQNFMGNNPETDIILADSNHIRSIANQFQLAGILAVTGVSPGMAMSGGGNEDRHFGGSQVATARVATVMWAGLVTFWNFIRSQNLQNRCLTIVTHEFTRTPWNRHMMEMEVVHNNVPKTIVSRGTDHMPINGLYLLSGKFPSARFGGIVDGFAAGGSKDLGTGPQLGIAAPSTLASVGTAMMAVFPEVFRHPGQPYSGRVVRELWPNFADSLIVQPLRDI